MNARFTINQWSMITSLMIAALITVGYYQLIQLQNFHGDESGFAQIAPQDEGSTIKDRLYLLRTWVLSIFWVLGALMTFFAVRFFKLNRKHYYWLVLGTLVSYVILRLIPIEKLVIGILASLVPDLLMASLLGVGFFMLVAAATFNMSLVSLVHPPKKQDHTDILDAQID